ncbi:hypothetical protein SteCoe_36180 [Stentor coeruleus]|uniref:Uncharacterized protein n=1 Tax=Stentor coeruleus TaxID=5963 RepID=A0A1R2AQM2_9CILI|nr:hypothetical protein SteCoe_36180 [Stentor coeruleus]
MGNCKSNEEPCDEEVKCTTNQKLKSMAVLTFAGPNAVEVSATESYQPTFSDPVFFSPKSNQDLLTSE